MVGILHISDPHAQTETMVRLNNLATFHSDWDVVALTGDCVSLTCEQLPPEWDEWPQVLKLAVPGNHDHPHTFDLLHSWYHDAPWACHLHDLAFVGLNSLSPAGIREVLTRVDLLDARGVVLLSHMPLRIEENSLAEFLLDFVGARELLVLHGHEHPANFSGTEWDESWFPGDKPYFRSKICSSAGSRGLGHFIKWSNGSFHCTEVQGPVEAIRPQGAIVYHPKFGKGWLVGRDGYGEGAKLTVKFPGYGVKKLIANSPGLKVEE